MLETDSTVAPPKTNLTWQFLRIVCPFEGHPCRPQTRLKSSENVSIDGGGSYFIELH